MSLKKEFTRGVLFTATAKYSGILISLAVISVLSRLLTPNQFGVVGVATVLIAFFNILGDIGIGPAIIQRDNLTKNDLRSIHSFTTVFGFILGTLFFLGAPLIANIYDDNQLSSICRWLSISIWATCWGIVPLNIQYKARQFKKIAIINVIVQLIVGFFACFTAYKGAGVYALVWQSILSTLIISVVYNIYGRIHLSLKIKAESLKKIYSFSIYQFLFNILVYFSRNLDKLLIGRYIGLVQLGYYDKSYRLMMLPLQNITYVLTPVILPIFSSIHDLRNIGEKYEKLLRPLSLISFPLSVILYACSSELIFIIFGNQWGPSILPLKILSLTVGFQVLVSTTGGIYQSAGATKQLFISGCWGAFFIITSFIVAISLWHTIEAVCIAYLIAQLANVIQCFSALFKVLQADKITPFRIMLKPIIMSGVIFTSLFFLDRVLNGWNMWISLLLKSVVGLLITAFLIQSFSQYRIINLLKGKFI